MFKLARIIRGAASIAVLALFVYAYFSPSISANTVLIPLTRLQFSAALYSAGIAAGAVIILLIITLIAGRVFCSALCPLGTAQEIVWRIGRRALNGANPRKKNFRFIPALLAGAGAALFAAPFVIILDPFSTLGSGLTAVRSIIEGHYETLLTVFFAGLIAILITAFFRGRAFCRWCPLGFTLGVFSRFSLFRLSIAHGCVSCGKCEKQCPTRCIASLDNEPQSKQIASEDCVLCLSCAASCPAKKIRWTMRSFKTPRPAGTPSARRDFLKQSLAAAGGALYLLGPSLKFLFPAAGRNTVRNEAASYILAPGAQDAKNFFSRCISCQACAAACPVKILKPAESPHPVLNYTSAGCQFNCIECGKVCPTNAIRHLTLEEKQRTRIALSRLDFSLCIVKTKFESCGACSEVCPTGAITMTPYAESGKNFLTMPVFDERYCIGCGACLAACPAEPRAISIAAVPSQTLTEGMRPSEDSGDYLAIPAEDFPF